MHPRLCLQHSALPPWSQLHGHPHAGGPNLQLGNPPTPSPLTFTLCPRPSRSFLSKKVINMTLRCHILIRLGRRCVSQGIAAYQVRPESDRILVAHVSSQGTESFWARKDPIVHPLFFFFTKEETRPRRISKGSARFSTFHALVSPRAGRGWSILV